MPRNSVPAFEAFVAQLRSIWATEREDDLRMEGARPLLEKLVVDPVLQMESRDWPSTEGGKNLLLYSDSDHGFVINGVVRVPGRTGRVHDHADTWVLYGVLDGSERLERYKRLDDGSRPDFADIELTSVSVGVPGSVDLVAPYDIHSEKGGPTRSAAIILRSQQLGAGTVKQGRYDPVTKIYFADFGATQVPYPLMEAPTLAL